MGATRSGDVRITVKRSQSGALKAAVKKARLSKSLAKKVKYTYTAKTATMVVRGVRNDDPHARKVWVIRIMDTLAKGKIKPLQAQV